MNEKQAHTPHGRGVSERDRKTCLNCRLEECRGDCPKAAQARGNKKFEYDKQRRAHLRAGGMR
jgi:hypothetical protein